MSEYNTVDDVIETIKDQKLKKVSTGKMSVLPKRNKQEKYIVTSDNHLAHRKTPTVHLANNFINSILTEENSDASVLFIAGDFFDRLINVNSEDFTVILELIDRILIYCKTNNMLLRVLEGTPSHDWKQSRIFPYLNHYGVNLKYFDVLDIEYIPEIDKHVLYIPDEWCRDHDDVEAQIQAKLDELGISQVDIAILHGLFQYHVAGIPYTGFTYKEDYFHQLVRGFMHIGHYHIHSSFDRIITQGSLDRHSHNEEEPKGYVIVNDKEWKFHENKNAFIYRSITIRDKTTLPALEKKIRKEPKGSHIRLLLSPTHPFNAMFNDIRSNYPDYQITRKAIDAKDSNTVTHILTDDEFLSMSNVETLSNVQEHVYGIIENKYDLNNRELDRVKDILTIFSGSEITENKLD